MLFVSFEGLDGSGKSTQAERLRARLEGAGLRVLSVREPGGTELSERVRQVLLDPDLSIDPLAEMLLFSAARAQLVRERVRPALEEGMVVVCDRFFDSTTAYQSGGRDIESIEWMTDFHRHVTGGLVPDRTYYVRVPLETARRRRTVRNSDLNRSSDRMEGADDDFFRRVAGVYEKLAEREPERFVTLDGTKPVVVLEQAIWDDVASRLHLSGGTARTRGGLSSAADM